MHRFVLESVPNPEESREVARKAIIILKDFVVDENLLHDMDLVLTEGCSNVARHAYDKIKDCSRLELTIEIHPGSHIVFEIADWGKGLCSKSIDFSMPSPEAVGGRGMFIMSELMDTFELIKVKEKNIIKLTRKLKDNQWRKK
ncbi:ATP-binding protein [Desulfovibrio sp. JC022]|uniref:ATP-binding protein n=1 Tax=Desulfovibrio sp. JC022 TaxID=2593642 RepID=UPI0013D4A97D|nr:ATP-binding protein [Desulfovibrio sp. JC022]NDV22471.1 ATP-binding protein [Desulfovibrio sp. JC022]